VKIVIKALMILKIYVEALKETSIRIYSSEK